MHDKRLTNGYCRSELWKGVAAGFIGGLVAAWTLNRIGNVWSKIGDGIKEWSRNEFADIWG